ncbi:MAG: formyltransferase family protein [Gammaproteobacteria bacterium]
MTRNSDYKVLVLTSEPDTIDTVSSIANAHFSNPTIVYWEFGDSVSKPDALRKIEEADYNLIISYINGIILKQHHLDRAAYGAINIHPAPPEHGGCWGIWAQPVICRDFRTHHGVTAHEIDSEIDHGSIYVVKRWEVPEDETIQSVFERSCAECMTLYKEVCEAIAQGTAGTKCFPPLDEQWHSTNRHHTVADIREWFSGLDAAHPAHQERVWLNHPRAIISPPYFDDV